jgi:hypothetical protein
MKFYTTILSIFALSFIGVMGFDAQSLCLDINRRSVCKAFDSCRWHKRDEKCMVNDRVEPEEPEEPTA